MAYQESDVINFFNTFIDRIDPVSGYCHFHASLILENIVPICHLKTDNPQKRIEEICKVILSDKVRDSILMTGSGAEGLYAPKYHDTRSVTKRADTLIETFVADLDMMYEINGVHVQDHGVPLKTANVEMIHTDCHPGYVRLKVLRDDINIAEIDEPFTVNYQGKSYLDTSQFHVRGVQRSLEPVDSSDIITIEDSLHGPAMSTDRTVITPSLNYKTVISSDLVTSIHCRFWPKAVLEWVQRKRQYGWPSKVLVEGIMSDGCHVVPVAHSSSTVAEIEWRLSFSKAELALARTFSVNIRRCYMLFKLLCQESMMPRKVIPSYYLKTLLLWVNEEHPMNFWNKEDLPTILFTLVDKLSHCLSKGHLPSYFYPENNLISHIPKAIINDLLKSLVKARTDPLAILFNFNDSMRLETARYPWRVTFKEAMEDMQKHTEKPDIVSTLRACAYSLHKMAFLNILDCNYKLAESAFLQMRPIMELFSGESSKPLKFMSKQALLLPDTIPDEELVSFAQCLQLFYLYLLKTYSHAQHKQLLYKDCGRLHLCITSMLRVWALNGEEFMEVKEEELEHYRKVPRETAEFMLSKAKETDTVELYSSVGLDLALLYLLSGEYNKATAIAKDILEKDHNQEYPDWSIYGVLECCVFEDLSKQFLDSDSPAQSTTIEQLIKTTGQVVIPSVLITLLILTTASKRLKSGDSDLYLKSMQEIVLDVIGNQACQVVFNMAKSV